MTLGTYLRNLHTRLDTADLELMGLYGEAFIEPANDKGITRLETLDAALAQLITEAEDARQHLASILEVRRAT